MITKWKLKNFKSVRELTDLKFSPLTIFAGSNSSGKSTILQSILLINQSLSSRIASRSVVLNGHILKLGQFDDLKTFGSIENEILIGWEFNPKMNREIYFSPYLSLLEDNVISQKEIESIICEISFGSGATDDKSNYQLQPKLIRNLLLWKYIDDDEMSNYIKITLSSSKDEKLIIRNINTDNPSFLQALDYDVEIDPINNEILHLEYPSSIPIGVRLSHFLPGRVLVHFDQNDILSRYISSSISMLISPNPKDYFAIRMNDNFNSRVIPRKVINTISNLLGDVFIELFHQDDKHNYTLEEIIRKIESVGLEKRWLLDESKIKDFKNEITKIIKEDFEEDFQLNYSRLLPYLQIARFVDDYFTSSIKYLGPLRDEPRSLYPLSGSIDPLDIGSKGEHTAAVYDLYKSREVYYIKSESYKLASVNPQRIKTTLELAVSDWLTYLGVAIDVETEDRGKFGHELKVITEGSVNKQDLTHVGVGVSQVLPILVMCLLADEDTTIIIEQPELHLHPKVQSLLADFFLSMTLLEKQCIIETHSEYIINRLRFRAAAAEESSISDLIKIYFVEKKNGQTSFRSIDVNKYGAIMDWPEGFFDQSQSESEEILKAANKKYKSEKRK